MLYDCEESSASSFPCLPSNTGFSQYDHARYLLGKIDDGCCNLDHMQSGLVNKLICVFILLLMYLCWIWKYFEGSSVATHLQEALNKKARRVKDWQLRGTTNNGTWEGKTDQSIDPVSEIGLCLTSSIAILDNIIEKLNNEVFQQIYSDKFNEGKHCSGDFEFAGDELRGKTQWCWLLIIYW